MQRDFDIAGELATGMVPGPHPPYNRSVPRRDLCKHLGNPQAYSIVQNKWGQAKLLSARTGVETRRKVLAPRFTLRARFADLNF